MCLKLDARLIRDDGKKINDNEASMLIDRLFEILEETGYRGICTYKLEDENESNIVE